MPSQTVCAEAMSGELAPNVSTKSALYPMPVAASAANDRTAARWVHELASTAATSRAMTRGSPKSAALSSSPR
jgi:hypothetical protein